MVTWNTLKEFVGYLFMATGTIIFAAGYLVSARFFLNETNAGWFIGVSVGYFLICLMIGAMCLHEEHKEG